jgi:hypothetical protein
VGTLVGNNLLVARLAMIPLSLIVVGLALLYARSLSAIKNKPANRVGALMMFIVGGLLILISQRNIYFSISHAPFMADVVVQVELIAQSVASIGVIFLSVLNVRKKTRGNSG